MNEKKFKEFLEISGCFAGRFLDGNCLELLYSSLKKEKMVPDNI